MSTATSSTAVAHFERNGFVILLDALSIEQLLTCFLFFTYMYKTRPSKRSSTLLVETSVVNTRLGLKLWGGRCYRN